MSGLYQNFGFAAVAQYDFKCSNKVVENRVLSYVYKCL